MKLIRTDCVRAAASCAATAATCPGWVMVTVMTAILVVAILGIFEPQIKDALSGIIDSVSGRTNDARGCGARTPARRSSTSC